MSVETFESFAWVQMNNDDGFPWQELTPELLNEFFAAVEAYRAQQAESGALLAPEGGRELRPVRGRAAARKDPVPAVRAEVLGSDEALGVEAKG